MKSVKLHPNELTPELDAALVGDFPSLRDGSDDANHFAMAFGSEAGQPWWRETEPQSLLGIAAKAVSSERRGETEIACSLYRQVVVDGDGWVRLLGLLLEGWSQELECVEPVHEAAQEVRRLRAGQRKARLLAKLSLFAADRGDRGAARQLWQEATRASRDGTELARAMRIEEINLGLREATQELLESPNPKPRSEPLVDPDALAALRLRGANMAIEQSLEDGLGGPWRYTLRMGQTPLDQLITADLQATWIGLPWARRPIRKQMGAQLLTGGASDASHWAHGILMWTLGDGRQCDLALRNAEIHFDYDSADFVLRGVGECDPTRKRNQRLATLGAEAWDLVSDDVLRWLVSEVPPVDGEHSLGDESRRIWAAFAVRLPREWYPRYRDLDDETRTSLLDFINPSALRYFDDEMKASMWSALADDSKLMADGGALLPLAAALAPENGEKRLARLIEDGRVYARIVADLIDENSTLITSKVQSRVLATLRDSVLEQTDKARKGTVEMGGSPRLELGRMLSVVRNADRSLIDLLLDVATDPSAPPQYVAEALQGLILFRRRQRLKAADLRRLRKAPAHPGQSPMGEGFTQRVLRAFRLQVLADRLTASERTELVGAVRSREVRVRSIAVNACAEALQTTLDESLAWAVVSGMFDPSDNVASGALLGLDALTEHFENAAEVAWQRLPEMFEASQRNVRGRIVDAAALASPKTKAQKQTQKTILARARQDRSWMIRDQVRRLLTEGL